MGIRVSGTARADYSVSFSIAAKRRRISPSSSTSPTLDSILESQSPDQR